MSTPKRRKVSGPNDTAAQSPASQGSSTKKKATQQRDQYSQPKLAESLALPDVVALKDWLESPLYKRRWDEFKTHGLPKKGTGKKGWEFASVHTHLLEGERNGLCKFSDRESGPATFDGYIDCLAWLLYVLTTENTNKRNGVFYNSKLPEIQRYQRMYLVIKYSIWQCSPSRAQAAGPSRKQAVVPVGFSPGENEPDSDEDLLELDITKGVLRVHWNNIPEEVEDAGDVNSVSIVKEFCSFMTPEDFYERLRADFSLTEIGHDVATLTVGDFGTSEWDELRRYVHDAGKRINADLETAAIELVPEEILPALPHESKYTQQDRRLLWHEILAEREAAGAAQMDLTVRYWQYQLLRAVAMQKWNVPLKKIKVKLQSEEVPTDGDAHASYLGLQYNITLDQLRDALAEGSERASEDEVNPDAESGDEDTVEAPATKLHEITQGEIDRYKEEVSWLRNPAYERDNHVEACQKLGIRNHEKPHMDGMFRAAVLRFYQPTAVYALAQFEDSDIGGGCLADEVGVGKTYETTAFMLYQSNIRRDRRKVGVAVSAPKPTVLLVPKGIIKQWKEKILSFTDRFRIVVYYGASKKRSEENVDYRGPLTKDDALFDLKCEDNASTIIISTVATFGTRHGPRKQWEWRVSEYMRANNVTRSVASKIVNEQHGDTYYELEPEFEGNLSGRIGRLIVDEGHELRHQPPEYGTALDWLRADKRLMITATPTRKGIHEFSGIMHYLQNPLLNETKYLRNLGFSASECGGSTPLSQILEKFDPWSVASTDPKAQLRFTDIALDTYVFQGLDQVQMGVRMREVLEKVLIKRSYASTVSGRRIDEDLPEVQRTTIPCPFEEEERLMYDALYAQATMKLCHIETDNPDAGVRWNPAVYRQLCMLTSWIAFQWLKDYKVKQLKQFRKDKKNATSIILDIRREQRAENVPEDVILPVPSAKDVQATLNIMSNGSPKLRMLLHLLSDIVVLSQEKVIVWVQFPAQMEWLRCTLVAAGFDARCLCADLNQRARETLTDDFHQNADGFKILIASYLVSPSGLDLHGYCRTIIEFEPAPDEATRIQVVGRVQRVGQDRWIRHIILVVEDSFDTKRVASAMLQNLPGLLTQLNLDTWGKDAEGVSLGEWVLDGSVLRKADDPAVQGFGLEVLSPEALLLHIQQRLSGQEVGGDIQSIENVAYGQAVNDRLW